MNTLRNALATILTALFAVITLTAAPAHASNEQVEILPLRCAQDGSHDTVVRLSVTGGRVSWEASYTGNGAGTFGGVTNSDIRFKIPESSTVRVNVWANQAQSGDVLLDVTRKALLC